MASKKVGLAYIANESKRKETLKKRKNGLIKKVDEISTLCGIEACAIIYSPNDPQPQVWPSESGAQGVISRFRRMPELEKNKKMLSQESFLSQMVNKAQDQLRKQRNENRNNEMTHLMFQWLYGESNIFNNASSTDLNNLSLLIDQNLNEIERKMSNVENGRETTNNVGGQQGHMDHVQMLQTNMDAMQSQNWSTDFLNGVFGDKMLPSGGDVNIHNGHLPNPFLP